MRKSKIKKLSFNKNSIIELNKQQMMYAIGGSVINTNDIEPSVTMTMVSLNTQTNPKSGYSTNCIYAIE
jgi:natural product precursor